VGLEVGRGVAPRLTVAAAHAGTRPCPSLAGRLVARPAGVPCPRAQGGQARDQGPARVRRVPPAATVMAMTSTQPTDQLDQRAIAGPPDMKLEVVVVPVADVDRAKAFYAGLGWRMDIDHTTPAGLRVVQLTPPGSATAIIVGDGITDAAPGSLRELQLVVADIDAARARLIAAGAAVSEVFHDAGGVFHHAGTAERVTGPDPQRRSYGSFASFADPDGNGWVLQEVTRRGPGRISAEETAFASVADLEGALRRAAAAHGEHEARTGAPDGNWPAWYADYMVREQSGAALPD
jgi:catechol 2,3-dioxygenase-like lactoylglutathione lyase family enzyme